MGRSLRSMLAFGGARYHESPVATLKMLMPMLGDFVAPFEKWVRPAEVTKVRRSMMRCRYSNERLMAALMCEPMA